MSNSNNNIFDTISYKTLAWLVTASVAIISITWIVLTEVSLKPIERQLAKEISESEIYRVQNEKISKEWQIARIDISTTAKQLNDSKKELIKTNTQLAKVNENFEKKTNQLIAANKELDKTKILFTEVQAKLEETNISLDKAGLSISEKQEIILKKSEQINEFSQNLIQKDEEIGEIIESLEQKNEALNGINEKLDLSEKEIERRRVEISKIHNGLNTILDDMTKISKSGKDDLENLKKGINLLLKVLDSKKEELEKLKLPVMIEKIAKQSTEEFCNSSEYPFEAKINITEESDTVDAEFYIESKVNFKIGKYTMDQAYQSTCFIEVIGDFIKNVKSQTLEYSDLQITGLFEGGADAVSQSHVGTYKGELGSTVVIDNANVNGRNINKSFYQGKKITNEDLALLRAYSVYATFKSLADSNAMRLTERQINFVANEYDQKGTNSRFGKIIVKLHRKNRHRTPPLLQ